MCGGDVLVCPGVERSRPLCVHCLENIVHLLPFGEDDFRELPGEQVDCLGEVPVECGEFDDE